jgi:transglutaminase-like putative cysteine protease
MTRIFHDFTFRPGFTTVSTPLTEVLRHRSGVCQDFAHLAIGCLRSLGLAARYVSGYIETLPPPGQERLQGADVSHAWFSVFAPGLGWFDFDPTNNLVPGAQHIITAWGRDFSDVTPLKGIIFSGGSHRLTVSVDVERQGEGAGRAE